MLATAMQALNVTADRVSVILIGNPALLVHARDAVEAIGGVPIAEADWSALQRGDPLPGSRALVVIEARGVSDETLAAVLPRIDAAAAAVDAPVVVSIAAPSIDVAAAALLGPRTQILCDPDATEYAVALTLAAQVLGRSALTDTFYEGEAARLQRLNEEVARIAEVLARLTQRAGVEHHSGVPQVADRRNAFGAQPMDGITIDPGEIRRAIRGRRLRDQFFGTGLFEEPGWDCLLDLFAAELEGTRVSVSSLCIAAAVAPTTALRWISKLTEAGLLQRQPDPFDRRRAYMELSERASRAMRDYVGAMRRAGLSLA